MFRKLLTLLAIFLVHSLMGQEVTHEHSIHHAFIENKGQWDDHVLFMNKFEGGNMWVEQGRVLFHLQDYSEYNDLHFSKKQSSEGALTFNQKVVNLHFLGMKEITSIEKKGETDHFFNYFIGKDRSRWASGVRGYEEFTLKEAYNGIDLTFIEQEKVLVAEPDFLFLDEPTNHLDLDMIEWLEEYLTKSKSTIFMVTHDRYFLEVVTDVIYELEDETLYRYKGNFSYYLEKKAEREELHATVVGKARNHMKKELEWIRRQPKARGTKQKARIESFHETKKVASQNLEKEELQLDTKMERLGTKILELHNISKSFPGKPIVNKLDYTFKRKERLGIVGPNGAGKSTLLRMIMGEETPDTGKIVIGDTVVFGYYSQQNIQVDEDMKVIDVIREVAEFIPLSKGREMSAAQFLEKFLFPRNMHYNFVRKLSGGEKRRLKLMKVLMANPNFLILDEPTNDLDIFVLSVLEDYLKNFEGCLIVVSHDRYFMDKMVDHIFVFEGDGEISDIIGNYTAYREKLKIEHKEAQEDKKIQAKQQAKEQREAEEAKKAAAKTTEEKRKLSFKEQREFESLDEEIMKLETEKESLTAILSKSDATSEELTEASKKLSEVVKAIEEKSERWMELAEYA